MIRVLIVEDEPPIARALATLIAQHPSFEVVGSEIDGSEALNRIAMGGIDVVFTDIRMPMMDGIALLGRIHEEYPHIFTIILSGYRDFDYAQAAIGYDAFDYLLKPLSKERITEVLDRVEQPYRIRENEAHRQRIMGAAAGESVPPDDRAVCTVAVICAGALSQIETDSPSPGQSFWQKTDLESLLQSSVGNDAFILVFGGKYKAEQIVIMEQMDAQCAVDVIDRLYDTLLGLSDLPITLVGNSQQIGIADVGKCIRYLNNTLNREMKLCQSQRIWRDFSKKQTCSPKNAMEDLPLEKVLEAIFAQSGAQLEEAMTYALELATGKGYTQLEFKRFLDSIINDGRIASGLNMHQYSMTIGSLEEAFSNTIDISGLCAMLVSILLPLGEGSKSDSKKIMKETVEEIEAFLVANYNKNISNEMLAGKFSFVPSYISKIFRKYKQLSPTEFVTKYRVSRAKEIMDSNPDVLVRDVASLVGYSDQYYFSKIFKREVGVWPTEYQKIAAPNEGAEYLAQRGVY